MDLRQVYNEILTEHNQHPEHEGMLSNANLILHGVNPSCGDDYTLQLKVEDGKIVDGGFLGEGCAISKASFDIMLDLFIGKTKEEALILIDCFYRMIQGKAEEADMQKLEEAGILENISHMPARVKCALLSWRTAKELLQKL